MEINQIQLQKALKFFKLRKNFTMEELKKVYYPLAKKYHPDNSAGEQNLKFMQMINAHYRVLLNYRRKNPLTINTDTMKKNAKPIINTDTMKENAKPKRRSFMQYKIDFLHEIILIDKKKYKNVKTIVSLCDNFLNLLQETKDLEKKIDKISDSYHTKKWELIREKEKIDEENFDNKKRAMVSYFDNKFKKFIIYNPSLASKASEIYQKIIDLFSVCTMENYNFLVEKLANINFNNIEKEMEYLKTINIYPIYIHIPTGRVVHVVRKVDRDIYLTRKLGEEPYRISKLDFMCDYYSIDDFAKYSTYVGDCVVEQYSNSGYVRGDLPLSRYLYYNEKIKLMLVYKIDEDPPYFYFIAGEGRPFSFEYFSDYEREDAEQGLFRNRDILREALIDNFNEKKLDIKMYRSHDNTKESGRRM